MSASGSTSGSCLCGQITVTIPQEALNRTEAIAQCRCKNCRQTGGTTASLVAIVPEQYIKIRGQPQIYNDSNTASGNIIQRAFCGNCGSPIYTQSPTTPGMKVVKLGLFDQLPKPGLELFCKDRPQWQKGIDGVKEFQTVPK
ncbi:unnamed protein product [Didymodactylos carnosus]|uniref:CENP-V/GFA domain-containing protein n=1 Tax=Didymodactylos carnosus TaxID=1234261 RepID=A0A814PBI9_9BILA|nr:unnamed protein product [Didymodactylos carnosus]CAF3870258.1 unnamed protein product [Didymodactylos carnosus]